MRLIDADNLIQEIKKEYCNGCAKKCGNCSMEDAFRYMTSNEYAPTVDAVEVVRCKDCIYKKPNGYCAKEMTPYSGFATEEEADKWFCAGGERKTE